MTPDPWTAFVDSFDPGVDGPYVASRAVRDVDLPALAGWTGHLRVVLTGGAAQLGGPVGFCARRDELILTGLDTALRDVDDPAGNARRVMAAARDIPGGVPADVQLHVRVTGEPTVRWLEALDVLAESDVDLDVLAALPLADGDPEPWIDAALDRELAFSLVGGTVRQVVDAVRTTARLWGDADDLPAARRWCRGWLVDDEPGAAAAAVDRLAALGVGR